MQFQIRSLTNMCSGPLDLFTKLERHGSDFSDAMRKMNPPSTSSSGTISRKYTSNSVLNSKKAKEALHPKRMYEEAQMVRRVKAYLVKRPIISDEDALHKLSIEVEPPPQSSSSITVQKSTSSLNNHPANRTLSAQGSTVSLGSAKGIRRGTSPTPSINSTTSSTSHQSHNSEGRKSSTSGTKFGKF